jgi:hypothetical protein
MVRPPLARIITYDRGEHLARSERRNIFSAPVVGRLGLTLTEYFRTLTGQPTFSDSFDFMFYADIIIGQECRQAGHAN